VEAPHPNPYRGDTRRLERQEGATTIRIGVADQANAHDLAPAKGCSSRSACIGAGFNAREIASSSSRTAWQHPARPAVHWALGSVASHSSPSGAVHRWPLAARSQGLRTLAAGGEWCAVLESVRGGNPGLPGLGLR
jgi:hypothetical protein